MYSTVLTMWPKKASDTTHAWDRLRMVTTTVPFRLIRQSRITGPYGPALILVHVTGHIDFGRMGKMVQKKSFNYLRYITFYRYDIWLSLSQINFLSVANSVRHRSYHKWSQRQNATAMSLVTPPDESIEMVQYMPNWNHSEIWCLQKRFDRQSCSTGCTQAEESQGSSESAMKALEAPSSGKLENAYFLLILS